MADYWKSYEKKYCEFCRCWFVNNKANVQFHENSEKHKTNVQKRVDQIRRNKKAEDKARQDERLTVIRVEHAARRALQKQGKMAGISTKQLHNELNKVADERIYTEIFDKASQTSWCEIINAQGQRFFKNASTGEVSSSLPLLYLSVEEHAIVYPDMPSNDSTCNYVHRAGKRLRREKKGENPKKEVNEFAEIERIIQAHKQRDDGPRPNGTEIQSNSGMSKKTDGVYGEWEIVPKKEKPELQLPCEVKFTAKHGSGDREVDDGLGCAPERDRFKVDFEEMTPKSSKMPSSKGRTVEFKERRATRGRNIKRSD